MSNRPASLLHETSWQAAPWLAADILLPHARPQLASRWMLDEETGKPLCIWSLDTGTPLSPALREALLT